MVQQLDPDSLMSISCFIQYTNYKTIMISTANTEERNLKIHQHKLFHTFCNVVGFLMKDIWNVYLLIREITVESLSILTVPGGGIVVS